MGNSEHKSTVIYYILLLASVLKNQTARFQPGTEWKAGVFLGDYTSSLTIQLPVSSVIPNVAGHYSCRVTIVTGPMQDTATATVHCLDCLKNKSEVPEKMEMTENEAYASSTANAGAIYAMPNKQKKANTKANADAVYAKPNKKKKAKTKDVVYENAKRGLDNGGLQVDKNERKQVPKVGLDENGLTYVQIDTTNQKPAKNAKPRATPRPTAYATISYGQVGDPLPDEEEKE